MGFYEPVPEGDIDLQQGDVLYDVPFGYFDIFAASIKKRRGTVDLVARRYDGEDVTARLSYSWGIVMSQTCDVQAINSDASAASRKPIIIARARPIQKVISNYREDKSVSFVRELSNPGKNPALFYLPPADLNGASIERLVVDLSDIQRFGPDNLASVKKLVKLRLSPPALQAFQERCSYFFGRFAAPDNLYYSDAEIAEIQRREDEKHRNQTRS